MFQVSGLFAIIFYFKGAHEFASLISDFQVKKCAKLKKSVIKPQIRFAIYNEKGKKNEVIPLS
jgi:hypothetical protein